MTSSINLILPDQLAELRSFEAAVSLAADREAAMRMIAASVSGALGVPTVLIERRRGEWIMRGQASEGPTAYDVGAAWQRRSDREQPDPPMVTDVTVEGRGPWTCILLNGPRERALLLAFAGDWTLSQKLLADFAGRIAQSLERVVSVPKRTNLSGASAYGLARRLAQISDPARVQQAIVDTAVRALRAEKGSLALYDDAERTLAITATSGYPSVLVRHLRVSPGTGIVGSVFLTRRPLRVEDVHATSAGRPRLRYRTPSFLAVPLLGVGRTLGVVSVADRRDGQPFDRRDLALLRGMASIAALALDRLRATERASDMTQLAAVDPLTGLFNRRQFFARLDEEIERARRQPTPLTALLLDVDNFKQVNDRLGHPAGDAVLRVIGQLLRRSVRIFDVCARLGGDEFAILMPGGSAASGAQIAERIRQDVDGSQPPAGPWSEELHVTASVGIATAIGPINGEDLIARADQALYAAKHGGKNQVRSST